MKGKLIVIYNPSLEVMKKQLNFNKDLDSGFDIGYSQSIIIQNILQMK